MQIILAHDFKFHIFKYTKYKEIYLYKYMYILVHTYIRHVMNIVCEFIKLNILGTLKQMCTEI